MTRHQSKHDELLEDGLDVGACPGREPGPGLDPLALAGLRAASRDLTTVLARIETHLDAHEGYVAFSGGKDSLVVLDLARRVDPDVPVAFFDSGLEFPQTYQYLDQLAEAWRLNLHVHPATPTALQVLIASGAWDHHAPDPAAGVVPGLHEALITWPAAAAHAVHGSGELWGVRAGESRGRAAAYAHALRAETAACRCQPACERAAARERHGGTIARADATVAYGPIWNWTTAEVWGHITAHHLPVNPVYDQLRRLGAPETAMRISTLIDTHQLQTGRLVWLRAGWPDLFHQLQGALPRLREHL